MQRLVISRRPAQARYTIPVRGATVALEPGQVKKRIEGIDRYGMLAGRFSRSLISWY